ncbi:hypothetical protein ACHAPT_006341 [Fusarium lateritium]
MKTSSYAQLAAVGILSLASVATAMPKCSIDCFQDVIYAHPPMACKEATMYMCFCKMPSLQWYFVECCNKKCEDSEGAISFGTNLCEELGHPIETDKLTKPPITSEATLTDERPTVTGDDDTKPTTNDAAETTTADKSEAKTTEAAASTDAASTGASTAGASKTESKPEETEEAETSAAESAAETSAAAAESTAADAESTTAASDASADAATSTPTTEPNGANSVSVSGLFVAVGVVAAAFGLL